jgi:hypothetical protein
MYVLNYFDSITSATGASVIVSGSFSGERQHTLQLAINIPIILIMKQIIANAEAAST